METIFDHGVTPDEVEQLGLGRDTDHRGYIALLRRLGLDVELTAWKDLLRLARLREDRRWWQQLWEAAPLEKRRAVLPLSADVGWPEPYDGEP